MVVGFISIFCFNIITWDQSNNIAVKKTKKEIKKQQRTSKQKITTKKQQQQNNRSWSRKSMLSYLVTIVCVFFSSVGRFTITQSASK